MEKIELNRILKQRNFGRAFLLDTKSVISFVFETRLSSRTNAQHVGAIFAGFQFIGSCISAHFPDEPQFHSKRALAG